MCFLKINKLVFKSTLCTAMTIGFKEIHLFSEIIENIKLDFNIKDVLYYIDRNPNVIDINYHREKDWQINQGKL